MTARRKEERAQTVPIAMTTFSQKDIEKKRILQISDLAKNVPSLASNQNSSDANGFYSGQIRLRGLPGNRYLFRRCAAWQRRLQSGDGALPMARLPASFFDLDNTEVLKGPQGTLFGKNSIGGLISIEPKKPTNNFEGYASAEFGNYSDRKLEGAINIPIIDDKVMLRIAGQSQQRDGYTIDQSNGKDYDNRDYYSWRVSLVVRPTDDLENYFIYDGYYQHSNGSANIPSFVNPDFVLTQLGQGYVPLTPTNGPCVGTVTLGGPAAQSRLGPWRMRRKSPSNRIVPDCRSDSGSAEGLGHSRRRWPLHAWPRQGLFLRLHEQDDMGHQRQPDDQEHRRGPYLQAARLKRRLDQPAAAPEYW